MGFAGHTATLDISPPAQLHQLEVLQQLLVVQGTGCWC